MVVGVTALGSLQPEGLGTRIWTRRAKEEEEDWDWHDWALTSYSRALCVEPLFLPAPYGGDFGSTRARFGEVLFSVVWRLVVNCQQDTKGDIWDEGGVVSALKWAQFSSEVLCMRQSRADELSFM